jgi:hypothetical protein
VVRVWSWKDSHCGPWTTPDSILWAASTDREGGNSPRRWNARSNQVQLSTSTEAEEKKKKKKDGAKPGIILLIVFLLTTLWRWWRHTARKGNDGISDTSYSAIPLSYFDFLTVYPGTGDICWRS